MEKSVFVTVLARIYPALLLAAPGTAVRACTELQHLRNHDPALGSQTPKFIPLHGTGSIRCSHVGCIVCLSSDNCQQAQTDLASRMHPKPQPTA